MVWSAIVQRGRQNSFRIHLSNMLMSELRVGCRVVLTVALF